MVSPPSSPDFAGEEEQVRKSLNHALPLQKEIKESLAAQKEHQEKDSPGPVIAEPSSQMPFPSCNSLPYPIGNGTSNEFCLEDCDEQEYMSQSGNVLPSIDTVLPKRPTNFSSMHQPTQWNHEISPFIYNNSTPNGFSNIPQQWTSLPYPMHNYPYHTYSQIHQQPPPYHNSTFSGQYGQMMNPAAHCSPISSAKAATAPGIQPVVDIYKKAELDNGEANRPATALSTPLVADTSKNAPEPIPAPPAKSSNQTKRVYRPRKLRSLPPIEKREYKGPITRGMKKYLPKNRDPDEEKLHFEQSTRLLTSLGLQPLVKCPEQSVKDVCGLAGNIEMASDNEIESSSKEIANNQEPSNRQE